MIFSTPIQSVASLIALCSSLLLAACSTPASHQPATQNYLLTTAANIYLLGEVHDNPAGHQARLNTLQQIFQQQQQQNKQLVLLMEQFDFEQQARLSAAQAICRDVNCLLSYVQQPLVTPANTANANTTGTPRSNWHWPNYQALLQFALDHKIPILAANLSREQARKIVKADYDAVFSSTQLQRWQLSLGSQSDVHQALQQAQQQEVMIAHCQQIPAHLASGMAKAQIARDLLMAESLLKHDATAVLLAGNGHVRKDLGAPYWLNFAEKHALRKQLGAASASARPASSAVNWYSVAYLEQPAASSAYADQIFSIPGFARPDPCAAINKSTTPPKEKS